MFTGRNRWVSPELADYLRLVWIPLRCLSWVLGGRVWGVHIAGVPRHPDQQPESLECVRDPVKY